jgi:hypothetical protein
LVFLSVTNVFGDGVLNAVESDGAPRVQGSVIGAAVGDQVRLVIDGETYLASVNATTGAWAVNVDGYVAEGNASKTFVVELVRGGEVITSSSLSYDVDVIVPATALDLNDDTESMSEPDIILIAFLMLLFLWFQQLKKREIQSKSI